MVVTLILRPVLSYFILISDQAFSALPQQKDT